MESADIAAQSQLWFIIQTMDEIQTFVALIIYTFEREHCMGDSRNTR